MNNQEWLDLRKSGIGGSDASAILGLSPWKSPMDIWLDKKGLLEEAPDPKRDAMREFGLEAEPFIARKYEEQTGRKLRKLFLHGIVRDSQCDFLLGSPDRLVFGEPIGVELKTENIFQDNFGEPGTDQVPMHYLVQCAWYMMLTAYPEWHIALLRGDRQVAIYVIKRDLELEQTIRKRCISWWNTHIIGDIPPDIDGSNAWALYLTKKHPENITPPIEAEHEHEYLAEKLRQGIELQAKVEAEIEAIKNQLKQIIGDADGLRGDFGKITWRKSKDSVVVDWKGAFFHALSWMDAAQAQECIDRFSTHRIGSRRFVFNPAKKELQNGNGTAGTAALIGNGAEAASTARD